MSDLTLEKEMEMLNTQLVKVENEHREKRYLQHMPRKSMEVRRLRGLAHKLRKWIL